MSQNVIPITDPLLVLKVRAIMLAPGSRPEDLELREQFISQKSREVLKSSGDDIAAMDRAALMAFALEDGPQDRAYVQASWQASAVGQMTKALFALVTNHPDLASWEHAAQVCERFAEDNDEVGRRSSLMKAKARYHTVAHLWGAWDIRGGVFREDPSVGYTFHDDFHAFLCEAELLRWKLRNFKPQRANAEPLLPDTAWRMPDEWFPPERQANWPQTGGLPDLRLSDAQLSPLRPAGRPRKEKG